MTQEKTFITKEGLVELEKEQQHLIHVVRKEIIEDLQAARAQGDLSENADYDAARDKQAKIEARIRDLEVILSNVEIIATKKGGQKVIRLGTTFTMLDKETKKEETFTLVGSVEADPLNGKLSNVTALAQAVLEHREGDVVTVNTGTPYKVKILKIK